MLKRSHMLQFFGHYIFEEARRDVYSAHSEVTLVYSISQHER